LLYLDAEPAVKYGKGKGKGKGGKGKGVWWVPVTPAYYWGSGKGAHCFLAHYLLLRCLIGSLLLAVFFDCRKR